MQLVHIVLWNFRWRLARTGPPGAVIMKYVTDRPFADPEAAALALIEIN
jgi:hypothetical protein